MGRHFKGMGNAAGHDGIGLENIITFFSTII